MAQTIRLLNNERRAEAAQMCRSWPYGATVTFKERQRSIEQNDRMWAMLSDVAKQLEWHGQKLTKDQWKMVFLSGIHRDAGVVPDFSGTGVIPLNISSRKLTVPEMTQMIELIFAYGAERGVVWKNEQKDS